MAWIGSGNHYCQLRGWPRRPLLTICLIIVCIPFSVLVWKGMTLEVQWTSQPLSLDSIFGLKTNTPDISEVNLEPTVDRSVKDYREQMLESLPNLPLRYGQKPGTRRQSGRENCAKYPPLFDIRFNNIYWQVLHSRDGSFYLYSAFLDNRTLVTKKPSIRILGMIDRLKPIDTHCQIWYDGKDAPVVSKVIVYDYIWNKNWGNCKGLLQPYLLQCAVPEKYKQEVPQSVSLVEKPCQKPTNNLRIIYNLPPGGQKEDFAVCIKGLDFSHIDNSLRIAEWLELVFILGANKVFLYDLGVHPNVSKLLRYYESQGRVEITKLTLPADQPNALGLRHKYLTTKIKAAYLNELIPYNDCLYKNIYRYKFITLLDVDEVIMPRKVLTWKSLMEQLAPGAVAGHSHTHSSYYFRNVYFLDSMLEAHGSSKGIPLFMHMLQHVYRAASYTKPRFNIKCFHDPERILTVHNHFPLACVGGNCLHLQVPTEVAHLQHYRWDCHATLRNVCPYFRSRTRLDNSISRFRKPLINNTLHTLRHLGFLKE